jgi:hypothetical protein
MHLVALLIVLSGLVIVIYVGLVKVIRDLSEMSIHVSPQLPPMPLGPTGRIEEAHANKIARYESTLAEESEVE